MSDISKLMADALQQLEEHKAWLKEQLFTLGAEAVHHDESIMPLIAQVDGIKLRMSRVDAMDSISILWEYPDELLAFLRSDFTPQHLRASLEGGRLVELDQPGHSVKRAPNTPARSTR